MFIFFVFIASCFLFSSFRPSYSPISRCVAIATLFASFDCCFHLIILAYLFFLLFFLSIFYCPIIPWYLVLLILFILFCLLLRFKLIYAFLLWLIFIVFVFTSLVLLSFVFHFLLLMLFYSPVIFPVSCLSLAYLFSFQLPTFDLPLGLSTPCAFLLSLPFLSSSHSSAVVYMSLTFIVFFSSFLSLVLFFSSYLSCDIHPFFNFVLTSILWFSLF